jgi:hypothetical protein
MIDNLIILLLIIGAFIAGLATAGMYWRRLVNEWRYSCKILAADKGLGYIAPPEEETVLPLGQDFMDRLKANGRATKAIRTPRS